MATKVNKIDVAKTVQQVDDLLNQLSSIKITKRSITKETPNEVLEAIKQVGYIQSLEGKLGKAKNSLKNNIKELMKKFGLGQILADEFKASYTEFTSTDFDMEAFKQDHPKLYEKYCFKKDKSRFSVDANKAGK